MLSDCEEALKQIRDKGLSNKYFKQQKTSADADVFCLNLKSLIQ